MYPFSARVKRVEMFSVECVAVERECFSSQGLLGAKGVSEVGSIGGGDKREIPLRA